MADQMRVATGQFSDPTDDLLQYAGQMGVSGVVANTPSLPGETTWEVGNLVALRERIEAYGLRLESVENVPRHFYERAMLGVDGADEEITNYQTTIRHVGEAGIPILGYHWMPSGVWRTSRETAGRGGARVTAFDIDEADAATLTHDRVYSDDDLWATYTKFMDAVLPVAEASGVRLALHPDDPPVPSLGGIARIMRNFEGFKRALEIGDSPNHGLGFCMGCWSEMGEDVIGALRYFGSGGKIFYVHLRDVQGVAQSFQECFLGEGNVDVVQAIRTLHEVGFTGFMIDDHVPRMVGDEGWNHRGRAFTTGRMLGLVEAIAAPA